MRVGKVRSYHPRVYGDQGLNLSKPQPTAQSHTPDLYHNKTQFVQRSHIATQMHTQLRTCKLCNITNMTWLCRKHIIACFCFDFRDLQPTSKATLLINHCFLFQHDIMKQCANNDLSCYLIGAQLFMHQEQTDVQHAILATAYQTCIINEAEISQLIILVCLL